LPLAWLIAWGSWLADVVVERLDGIQSVNNIFERFFGRGLLQEWCDLVDVFIFFLPPLDFQQLLNDGPREASVK